MRRLFALAVLIIFVGAAPVSAHQLSPGIAQMLGIEPHEEVVNSAPDPRGWERTVISFPEWYIVYSAQEYADFVAAGGRPSQFPYFASINQYWESVEKSEAALAGKPIDETTNTVLQFIGGSITAEYTLIGAYEKTIGFLTETLNFFKKSPEDTYTDRVAKEYGLFLEHTPWYVFRYDTAITGLWTAWGWGSITPRGIERRIIFSVGYQLKGSYGAIIKKATRSQLGVATLDTKFAVRGISRSDLGTIGGVTDVQQSEGGSFVAKGPRYRAFNAIVEAVALYGGYFESIEGHDSIMITAIAATDAGCVISHEGYQFSMDMLTKPGLSRHALIVPVRELTRTFIDLQDCNVPIEHVYDY